MSFGVAVLIPPVQLQSDLKSLVMHIFTPVILLASSDAHVICSRSM